MTKKPRILLYDIENSATKAWVWQAYDTDVIKIIQPWHLLSFAFKWYGEGTPAEVRCLRDYRGYWKNQKNDEPLTRELWGLMNHADLVVAHNGNKHDWPKAMSRFAKYQLGMPAASKRVDTYQILKNQLKIEKNSLDHAAEYFGVGHKLPNTGFHLWERCTEGTELFTRAEVDAAWDEMCAYNLHDVDPLLEGVYEAVRPYAPNHPNLTNYTGEGCPVCQSTHLEKSGWHYLNSGKKQRWRCMAAGCGHRFVAGKIIKDAA